SREKVHIELDGEQMKVFLKDCTASTEQATAAAPSVPKTARAADVVTKGEWLKAKSGDVFGGEGAAEAEGVDLDEFCFPEKAEDLTDEAYAEAVAKLVKNSKFQTREARERYREVMLRSKAAYCSGLKDFVPGQVDEPKLKLAVDDT